MKCVAQRGDHHSAPTVTMNQVSPRHALGICLLALLAAAVAKTTTKVSVNKCCVPEQVLDAASKCVSRKNMSITVPVNKRGLRPGGVLLPPFDERWLRSWLPPGIPAGNVEDVWIKPQMFSNVTRPVTASALWDERELTNESYWRDTLVLEGDFVLRRRGVTRRVLRIPDYCVDATEDPRVPYALVQASACRPFEDVIIKCCRKGEALSKNLDGMWRCDQHKLRTNHSEIRYGSSLRNLKAQCSRYTKRFVESSPIQIENTDFCSHPIEEKFFFTVVKVCADTYIEGNETKNVLMYCDISRKTRGIYMLSRVLPFLTIGLLAGAMASIFRTERLRTSAHGWALASHGACLLGFNAGQILFLLTVTNNDIEAPMRFEFMHAYNAFGVIMYFLQVAAAAWLSALCLNMLLGFRKMKVLRAGGGSERRRFRWLCAGAWGFPAALTAACVATFATKARPGYVNIYRPWGKHIALFYKGPSYMPSFVETRTYFNELSYSQGKIATRKLGSLIFYYGPLVCLVVMNAVCIFLMARHVHFRRQGNSLPQRDREEGAGGRRKGAPHAGRTTGGGVTEAQSVMVYIKLLLSAGLVEAIVEVATWASIQISGEPQTNVQLRQNHSYMYRTAGYFSDLLRAMCVLWLAVPSVAEREAACWRRLIEGYGGDGRERGAGCWERGSSGKGQKKKKQKERN